MESRRRFLKLTAAGAAAMMIGSLESARRATAEGRNADHSGGARPPEIEAEIEKQKGYVAKTLETIRAYELPAGSNPGFVFAPLSPRAAGASARRPPRRSR